MSDHTHPTHPTGTTSPQEITPPADDPTQIQPEDMVEPENALPPMRLEELPPRLRQAVANAGWEGLMPVQARAIPYMLAGRDLMVQSRTGSGKTGAFLLPILDRIDPELAATQALILVPTRELARQVAQEAETLFQGMGVRILSIYGGVAYGPQLDSLEEGAHLVIGTPGRVLDHLMRRTLRLDELRVLVFDEADRMLSMGFYPDMREIQRYLPDRPFQAYMFSATLPAPVMRLARQFLHEPEFLSLSRDRVHVTQAEHILYTEEGMKKGRALVRLIELENPASAIIFCNTKRSVDFVTTVLQRFGYDADRLSSDLGQKDRERVLQRVRAGQLRFLVATDVVARGIDIPDLSHVFQYEPPQDPEAYIHRAGRTARAGAAGVVITLAGSWDERVQIQRIAARYGIELDERKLPGEEEVAQVVAERVTTLLEGKLRRRDNVLVERMQRFLPLVQEWGQSPEGQTLLAMLVDDFYQAALHEPDLFPTEEAAPAPTAKPQQRRESREGGRRRRRRRRR